MTYTPNDARVNEKTNGLRMSFAEWLYRMSEAQVPYQARGLATYAVLFKVTENDELARLSGMDMKGIADKTYNKWKKRLSDDGWVNVKSVTVGRQTTIEVQAAFRTSPVIFTDVRPRAPSKFYETDPVRVTRKNDSPPVQTTDEAVKVTGEPRPTVIPTDEHGVGTKEKSPHTPLKENNTNPTTGGDTTPRAKRSPQDEMFAALNPDGYAAAQDVRWTPDGKIEVFNGFKDELRKFFPDVEMSDGLSIVAGEHIDQRGRPTADGLRLMAAIRRKFGYLQNEHRGKNRRYKAASKPDGKPSVASIMRRY